MRGTPEIMEPVFFAPHSGNTDAMKFDTCAQESQDSYICSFGWCNDE